MAQPTASERASPVDESLLATFRRGRLPTLTGGVVVVVVIGMLDGRSLGPGPPALALFGLMSAIYERRHPESDPAIGMAVDIAVTCFLVWLLGVPSVVLAFGTMFAVLTTFFHSGRSRVLLLVHLGSFMMLALNVPPPTGWLEPGVGRVLAGVLPLMAVGLIVTILWLASSGLRKVEIERGYVMGTVAHELRNDLTPVVGLSMVLADEVAQLGRTDLAEMATMIAAQGRDAAETVDDLLTLARLDREALDLQIGPMALLDEVGQVVTRVGLVSVDIRGSGLDGAMADPVRVRQIVRNLCTNAARYGGNLVRIEVDTSLPDGCHLRVWDNGPGISDDEVSTIFEPFGRGAAGRRNAASVGLGLWIGRQLARAMDGELTYRREDGWTVFDLRLPAAPAAVAIDQPSSQDPSA
jgi:signal transduction histidine kinase